MKWATRAGCHVDRAACAWLIRRQLDTDPQFVFVEDSDEIPEGATPFDMRGVDLTHHGDDCTFETMLRRYELMDPALWEIARIVHEADLADERHHAPEGRGLDVIMRGLTLIADDTEVLSVAARIFDGLHEFFRRGLLQGHDPA